MSLHYKEYCSHFYTLVVTGSHLTYPDALFYVFLWEGIMEAGRVAIYQTVKVEYSTVIQGDPDRQLVEVPATEVRFRAFTDIPTEHRRVVRVLGRELSTVKVPLMERPRLDAGALGALDPND